MFQHRVESFFSDFLMSKDAPLGEISEHCINIEFQACGSPHAHCLLWIKNAPLIGKDDDETVCEFVEKYVHGTIPQATKKLADGRHLVMKLQTHSHSSYCHPHVNAKCRFNFPKPPSTRTVVARQLRADEKMEINVEENRNILHLIRENIEEDASVTIEGILQKEGISEERYIECLQVSSHHGSSIILKWNVVDMCTNNYNLDCITTWRANMDLQFIADSYACIMYILSYVMKLEHGMSETLKQVAKQFHDKEVAEQMKKIISTFANKRELSIHESGMRVMSQWLFKKSRTVVQISNGPKDERFRMPKPFHVLKDMDDDSEDIFMWSIHDRYEARPYDLKDICLANFGAKYSIVSDDASGKNVITLKNNMGKMRLRQKEAVIRTHRYSENDFRYFYSRLLLFLPWSNEDELIGGYSTYEEHYNVKLHTVEENAWKYNMDRSDVEEALENYMANPPEMSEWLAAGVNENDNVEEFLDNDGSSKDMMDEDQGDLQRNLHCH